MISWKLLHLFLHLFCKVCVHIHITQWCSQAVPGHSYICAQEWFLLVLRGMYMVLEIKPELAAGIASSLTPVLSLTPFLTRFVVSNLLIILVIQGDELVFFGATVSLGFIPGSVWKDHPWQWGGGGPLCGSGNQTQATACMLGKCFNICSIFPPCDIRGMKID